MANEDPIPDDLTSDPFEAELVAYLDGEADEATARKVEARLATDPAARTRAAELKKSFDLLDYLPRPEASPNFTTRTLDKLPAIKPGDSPSPREPQPTMGKLKNASPQKPGGVSTSVPVPLDSETPSRSRPQPRRARERQQPRSLAWAAGLIAAVVVFAGLGYLASAFARPYLFPRHREPDEPRVEVEPRVIENLPLYAVADDIGFVAELAKPDYFGDDPAVAFDPTLRIPPADTSDKPTGPQFDSLAKAFRALPAARQAEIAKLDQDLHAKEPKERDRLFRVLEAYAAWLARLPDGERRHILAATTSDARLKAVRAIRERHWVESLPQPLKAKLAAITDANEKNELIQQWKDEEAARRERWAFVRQHGEAFAANTSPWPFDTERGRNEVIEFAKATFKTDDLRRCRLSGTDLAEYKRTLDVAQRDGVWVWYGLAVYELNKLHPYLPEPESSKLMITEINDLPDQYRMVVTPKKTFGPRPKLDRVGKWPDFPLEVHKEVPLHMFGKGPFNVPPLGPSRLSEFKPSVREFAASTLFPKMSGDDKRDLDRQQGKWPEYPQRFMYYANKYDLSVPGVSLPGSPKRWEATYGVRPGPRDK